MYNIIFQDTQGHQHIVKAHSLLCARALHGMLARMGVEVLTEFPH